MKYFYHFLSLGLLAILCSFTTVQAQTTVNGTVSSDVTWTLANSPYQITDTVTVAAGATLTIEAGVTVQFDAATSLIINGAIIADGSSGNEITFTSSSGTPAAGDWGTIRLSNTSNVGSVIDHVIMEYGGAGAGGALLSYTTGAFSVDISNSIFRYSSQHGVDLRVSNPAITHSEFYYNGGYGIYTDFSLSFTVDSSRAAHNVLGGIRIPSNAEAEITASRIDSNGVGLLIDNGASPTIKKNNIRGNDTGIRVIQAGSTSPVIEDNTIAGNTNWGLNNLGTAIVSAEYNFWGKRSGPTNLTNPAGIGDRISDNVDFDPWLGDSATLPIKEITSNPSNGDIWYADTVYVIKNNITLPGSSTITIRPGTNIKFDGRYQFRVDGTMIADGTADSVIAFTSIKDDVYGGDTNGDARASAPSKGDWNYVYLSNTGTSSVLDYVNIRYAGSSASALYVSSTNVQLSNLFVDNNSRTGIQLLAVPDSFENIVSNANGNHGFYIQNGVNIKNVVAQRNAQSGLFLSVEYNNFSVTIDSSEFSFNNQDGVTVSGKYISTAGGRIDSLTNSTISNNKRDGFSANNAFNEKFYFSNNTVASNARDGITFFSKDTDETTAFFHNNTINDNADVGLRTTSARIYANSFDGNRKNLGMWGNLGYNYTNPVGGLDDNIFGSSTFGKAIELIDNDLEGTLQADLPLQLAGGAYLFRDQSGHSVESSDTLTIEPGVVIKFGSFGSGHNFSVNGVINIDANNADPVIFTSHRDDRYGGQTTAVTDTISAKRGDFYGLSLNTNGANKAEESIIRNLHVYYGSDAIYANGGETFVNEFDSLHIQYSNGNGLYLVDVNLIVNNSLIENNRRGIYGGSYRSSLPAAELRLRNTVVRNNNFEGVLSTTFIGGASAVPFLVKEITNSNISGNGYEGANLISPKAAVSIIGNTFDANGRHGLRIFHRDMDKEDISIAGNVFSNNGKSGVRTSAAKFIDNTFVNNEFGISQHGKLGYRYVDEIGVDGNVFTDNTYNNAIELYGDYLSDTLSTVFPAQITSGTYMFSRNGLSSWRSVAAGDSLIINPGVIMKMGHDAKPDFQVQGYLEAVGTKSDPITFTSYRDHTIGGKVTPASDTTTAKRGDWFYLFMNPTTSGANNAKYSKFEHVDFKYGEHAFYFSGALGEDMVTPIKNVTIDQMNSHGLFTIETGMTLDSVSITNARNDGFSAASYASDKNNAPSVRILNSYIANNGRNGVYTTTYVGNGTPYFVRQLSNTKILNNGNDGVQNLNVANPMSYQFNQIDGNGGNGLYVTHSDFATEDTVLTITSNKITNNGGIGIASSRAIIVADTLEGNRYPIGITGALSKPGTVNDQGNYYQDNVIRSHTVDSSTVIFGNVNGIIGGTKPGGYTNDLYIMDYNNAPRGTSNATVYVSNTDSLFIKPGVVIKSTTNARMRVDGKLYSMGNFDNKIVFTSIKDDTYLGNTNADTTGILPGKNDWSYIELNGIGTDSSIVKNTIVRYSNFGIYFRNSDALVDSSSLSNSNYGMYFEGDSDPTVRSSDIHSNTNGSIAYNTSSPLLHLNNFYNNTNYALYNATSPAQHIVAENNYWGDPSGPFVDNGPDLNVNGQGDRINVASGSVDYRPYLVGRNGILLGDVTINGTISAFDASKILLHVVGLDILTGNNLAAGDVTGNGTVSSMDASLVLQYVVGIISGFPGQGKIVVPEPQNMMALNYEDTDAFTDIIYNHKGKFDFYGAEMEVILPEGLIDNVELANSSFADHIELTFNQVGDTLRIAMASAKPIRQASDLGSIRLIYSDNSEATSLSERIKFNKFATNEVDLTEFVNQNFTTTEVETLIPEEFALNQNYPNPFNPSTNISYQLPADAKVQVQVYNMLGQLVQTLVDDNQKAGVYNLRWDASTFSSGTYLLRIEVQGEDNQNYSQIRKMLLIK